MLTRSGLCLSALTGIKTEDRAAARLPETMGNPVFKCPRTGMNVQPWLADTPAPDDPHCSYQTVMCQACGRLHCINRSTGKLLGAKDR